MAWFLGHFAMGAIAAPPPGSLVEVGVAALRAGRPGEAQALLVEATEATPDDVAAWWSLGWLHYEAGRFPGAVEAWSQVAALDPDHREIRLWQAAATTRAAYGVPVSPAPVEAVAGEGRIRIVAAGDTMMGSDLRGPDGLPPGDGSALFTDVSDLLSAADLTFVNLEGPLADGVPSDKCGVDASSCYAFRTPTRFAPALAGAGIDVVSLANNHAFDLGLAGQDATMAALEGVGIAHAGRYGDVATVTAKGISVAVVAAHSGTCCLSVNDLDEVRAAVAQVDRDHDLVILSFHGGAEGADHRHVPGEVEIAWGERRGDVSALAHAAIDAGADLVFGHGPHVLRGMEVYRGRLVAYSLGNFLGYEAFGRSGGYGRRTVLVDAEVAANGVLLSARLHSLRLDRDAVPHPDPDGAALEDVRELSAADFPETGVTVGADGVLTWRR